MQGHYTPSAGSGITGIGIAIDGKGSKDIRITGLGSSVFVEIDINGGTTGAFGAGNDSGNGFGGGFVIADLPSC